MLTLDDRGGRRNQLPPRTAPESTAVRMRKMVLKYADDEVCCRVDWLLRAE